MNLPRLIQTAGLTFALVSPMCVYAQETLPPVTRTYAFTNATVFQGPDRKMEGGTVVVKDGLITAVGKGIAVPPDAIVIRADSMYIYAGFIDGFSRVGVTKPKEEQRERLKDPGNPPPDRAGITPQNDVRNALNPADKSIEELRNLGFTVAQVVPYGNFLPGQGAIVMLNGKPADQMVIQNRSALYSELTGNQNIYPNTVMAVMAKWRDLYRQATLSKNYEALYAANRSGLERPATDRVLEAFYPVIDQKLPVLFRGEKVLEIQRVLALQNDLKFALQLGDVKEGWPIIPKVKASGARLFLSLDLPEEIKKEKKEDSADAERTALEKRKADMIAKATAQAAEFQKAGVPFGFSTATVKVSNIPAHLRRIVAAGLPESAALAALTTDPARLLGLSDRLGTIDAGKMANLVVSDKPYFNEKATVRYVMVDGDLFKLEKKEAKKADGKVNAAGAWSYKVESPQGGSGKIVIKDDGKGNLSGTITHSSTGSETELKDVELDGKTLSFGFDITMGPNTLSLRVTATVETDSLDGTMTVGNFGSFPMKATRDPKK
jgi:imidazolonepropionase-like amidohydrolase